MYGQIRQLDNGKKQRRYRCRAVDNYGAKLGCGRVFRDAAALDAFIAEAVLTRLDSPEVAAALASNKDEDEAKRLAEDLMRLRIRRKDIARRLALASGEDEQDLGVMLETVRDAIEQTQRELAKLQSQNNAGMLPAQGTLRQAWGTANIDWRRDVIRLIVERITVAPSGGRQGTWNGFRFNQELISVAWLA